MIIDAHNQLGVTPHIAFFAEDLIQKMDEASQDMALVFPMIETFEFAPPRYNPYAGNDYIAEAQRRFPDRLIGIGATDPRYQIYHGLSRDLPREVVGPAVSEVKHALLDLGLRGIRLHPAQQNWPIDHFQIMGPIFDAISESQELLGRRVYTIIHSAGDSVQNAPASVARVAVRYPHLTLATAQAGSGWGREGFEDILGPLENVVFDVTYGPADTTLRGLIDAVGHERIVVGANEPRGSFALKMALVDAQPLSGIVKEAILGGNLKRLLGN